MDRRQQVFVKLKLKAKALGFNSKELKGIAAKIADNLESQEDASEEDVNAEECGQISDCRGAKTTLRLRGVHIVELDT